MTVLGWRRRLPVLDEMTRKNKSEAVGPPRAARNSKMNCDVQEQLIFTECYVIAVSQEHATGKMARVELDTNWMEITIGAMLDCQQFELKN